MRNPVSRPALGRWRAVAVVAALAVSAAACGDDDDSAATSPAADSTPSTASPQPSEATPDKVAAGSTAALGSTAPASEFPVTIEHKYGSTEVDAAPERVITVGLSDQDAVLALGTTPIATTEWFGEQRGAIFPWAEDALGDDEVPTVLTATDGVDFERIASLEPDLILAQYAGLTEQEYDTLAAIAPTVPQPADVEDWTIAWQDQTRRIGQSLGHAADAEALVEQVEAQFDAERAAHPEFDGATAIAAYDFGGGEVGVYGPNDPRTRILTRLGFEVPPAIGDLAGDEFYAEISMEQLGLLDADVVVLLAYLEGKKASLGNNPVYEQLAVVEEGRVVGLADDDPLVGAFSFSSVLSVPYLLDGLVPQLAAAIDGDPGTQ